MPKLKTRHTVARRIKVTSTGKLLRRMSGVGHLKTKKSRNRKRRLKKDVRLFPGVEAKLRKLLS